MGIRHETKFLTGQFWRSSLRAAPPSKPVAAVPAGFLKPDLTPPERAVARVEEWILGVPGLIYDGSGEHAGPGSETCNVDAFRLH